VLLKNAGALLPLDRTKLRTVAVVGPNAYPAVPAGGGSARVEPFAAVSLLEGLAAALGPKAVVTYHRGLPSLNELMEDTEIRTAESGGERGLTLQLFDNAELSGTPSETRVVRRGSGNNDALQSPPATASRWTGYFTPKAAGEHDVFVLGPGETSGYRLYLDDRLVIDSWDVVPELLSARRVALSAAAHKVVVEQHQRRHDRGFRFRVGIARTGALVAAEAKALAARADAVVVAAGFDPETESEGADRTFALPFGQDDLIREMSAANKSTIVVLSSGGGVDMTAWLERVPAVVQAWFPGEAGGTALAEILLGDTNPSGRLPATFERRFEDNPVHGSYYPDPGTRRIPYREGVFVGYRGYEKNNTTPQFAFGHGLSYTTFGYGKLSITPAESSDGNVEVSFDVSNTGTRAGAEVAQVYVGEKAPRLPRPGKELKGFAKVSLQPGETKRVTLALDRRAFSYYDVASKQWRADAGVFDVLVGRASDAIELRGAVRLVKALLTPR
jgi:beta-glucosidase